MNFVYKKMIGLALFGFVIVIGTVLSTLFFNDILIGLLIGTALILPCYLFASAMFTDPIIEIIEGKGMACFDINSSGVIQPYSVQINMPLIAAQTRIGRLTGIFDRKITNTLLAPKQGFAYKVDETEEWKAIASKIVVGDVIMVLKKDELVNARFDLRGRPTFFINTRLGTFVTKEMIANSESIIMTEHLALTVLASMKEFKIAVSGLNKHLADLFKPNNVLGFLRSPWFMIILSILMILILFLFVGPMLPKILASFSGTAEAVTGVNPPPVPSVPQIPNP